MDLERDTRDNSIGQTGSMTHKSDVYSFGVVLFEVLCRRSAILPDEEFREGLLRQLAKSHLDLHLREQMDPEAFEILSEIAYYCIEEERAKRPHIDQVVKRLEKALQLQWEHLELLSNSSSNEGVDKCDVPKKRSTVAIKRIKNQEGEEGFIAEIETLTSCKHENIISLLGFCYEGNGEMILVYDHASKGSLENYLGRSDKMTNLTWVQRLNICLDIAHGLNYIHNNTDHGKQKMIHRDIKSDNILLGDNWKAKIADFGLSKFHPADQSASTFYTSMIAGTYVYLDPEYQKDGKLSKKSDIYSFGVVLLEILTGRLAYDSVYTKVNEKGIAPIARDHFKKGTIMEIVDHKIKEETDEHVFSLSKGPNKESLDIFLEIAFRCVAETQAQRPTIEVVINQLKKALDSHKKALRGISHKPQSMSDEDWLELDEKALATIQLFLTREVLREVIHETTAAGTSTQDHLDEFNNILIDLENLDVDIDDEDKAVLLVISLPTSYKHFKEIMLYGNRETLSFDDVKSVLLSKQKSDGDVYLAIDTEKSKDELIVDSGCTFHMIPHRSWFTTYESFNGGNVYMGNHSICPVIGKGNIQVKMHDGVVRTITGVRRVLDLKRNLISLSTLEVNGCKYSGEGGVMKIFKGALVLMNAIQSGGLYVLQGTVVYGTAGVATSKASLNDSKLWHYRLGHMGEKCMKYLAKKGLIKVSCNLEFCEHCVFGK
ncbi:kinase-like domain, phloem protein 2-like protein [Tanacetum coccineum]